MGKNQPAPGRNQQKEYQEREQLGCVGVLGLKSQPHRQSGQNPKSFFPRLFDRLPKRPCRHRPEKDAQRIDGHENAAHRKERHHRGRHHCGQTHAIAVEHPPQKKNQPSGPRREQHGRQAHRPDGIPQETCKNPNHEGSPGPFAVVAPVQKPSALPVVRLIPHEIQPGRKPQTKNRHQADPEEGPTGFTAVQNPGHNP